MDENQVNQYFDLMKKDIFEANEYRHSLVPKFLYKYCPIIKVAPSKTEFKMEKYHGTHEI